MLYRILRDLGSINAAKRRAAIMMARGLPWEDLEQLLGFFDKAQTDAKRSMWTYILILLVVGAGTVFLFQKELIRFGMLVPASVLVVFIPVPLFLAFGGTRRRSESALQTILNEMDDAAFVPVALAMLSERQADHFTFRNDILQAIARLLPEVTLAASKEWAPEERRALSNGLHTVLPASAGGRDSLSTSPPDFAMVILKVLQRVGDQREAELVRLVSTIDPITEQHQRVREASVKCLKSIEKRLIESGVVLRTGSNGAQARPSEVSLVEVNLGHLLKREYSSEHQSG